MILVDSYWLLHKCKYKLDFLKTTKGVPTGMEYGFLKSCEALEREFKDRVVLCWEGRSFRYSLFPGYKAGRDSKIEPERIAKFKKFVHNIHACAEHPELEADDVIASLCGREKTLIYSNDKDLLQLIDDQTTVLKSFQEKYFPWDAREVERKMFGLLPSELPLFFAWIGDSVDSIPGSGLFQSKVASAIIWSRDGHKVFRGWPLWTGKDLRIIDSWNPRLDLLNLRKENVEIKEKLWNTKEMEKWFISMEICSLKVCGKIGMFQTGEF